MSAFIRYLPTATQLLPWLSNLATWLVARAFSMPEPLVQATGVFVYLQVQAFEHGAGKSLCPARLARRIKSWLRRPAAP